MTLLERLLTGGLPDADLMERSGEELGHTLTTLIRESTAGAERADLVAQLLRCGAAQVVSPAGWSHQQLAVLRDHPESLKLLLKSGVDPTAADSQGRTLLYLSIIHRSKSVRQLLTPYGSDPFSTLLSGEEEDIEALSLASFSGSSLLSDMLLFLVDEYRGSVKRAGLPFDPRTWGSEEERVLRSLCDVPFRAMRILGDAGVDWNTQDKRRHPLHAAVQTRSVKMISFLLKHGATVERARYSRPRIWSTIMEFPPNRAALERAIAQG